MGSQTLLRRLMKSRLRRFLLQEMVAVFPERDWSTAIDVESSILAQIELEWCDVRPASPTTTARARAILDATKMPLSFEGVDATWMQPRIQKWAEAAIHEPLPLR